jgi:hypothetical protein
MPKTERLQGTAVAEKGSNLMRQRLFIPRRRLAHRELT